MTIVGIETSDLFVTDAVERQNARKKMMKEYCLTHSYEAKPPTTRNSLGFIVVDDENKIIYCTIPKVSTTTWKGVLLDLRGLKRNKVCIFTVVQEIPPKNFNLPKSKTKKLILLNCRRSPIHTKTPTKTFLLYDKECNAKPHFQPRKCSHLFFKETEIQLIYTGSTY